MQLPMPTATASTTKADMDAPVIIPVYHIIAGKLFSPDTLKFVPDQVITVDRELGVILSVMDLRELRSASPTIFFAAGTLDSLAKPGKPGRSRMPLGSLMPNLSTLLPGGKGAAMKDWILEGEVIDLSHLTVLPGFIDVHVHLFLYAYSKTSWQAQLTGEHIAERTLRAGVHARKTLMAGFTTVRDLGTEGAGDADVALRKCLARKIIPGPRYIIANRAIVSTGSYGPKSSIHLNEDGVEGVMGAEVADGRDGCIRAVRRQIGAGADWIKIYADYRIRSRMADVSLSASSQAIGTFSRDEIEAMVTTAHDAGLKVAAHAMSPSVVKTLIDLHVDTIEHATQTTSSLLTHFAQSKHSIWVPTLAAVYTQKKMGVAGAADRWEAAKQGFGEALEMGMENIACGGDTGVFDHGENALEMVLMRRLGAQGARVLRWATLGGWMCVRGMEWDGEEGREKVRKAEILEQWERVVRARGAGVSELGFGERDLPFGVVRKGWAGDLVGVEGDLKGGVEEFERAVGVKGVKFVMKAGTVYKRDGVELVQ